MATDLRFGSKVDSFSVREAAMGTRLDSGPFVGIIKNNYDPARLGRVQVYIPELGGLDPEDPKFWRTVSYASPFLGSTNTPVENSVNFYGTTKESYGFWMTPPDVGVQVLCIFAGGDPNRGYYIGCIPDTAANHMIPAIGGSAKAKSQDLDPQQRRVSNGATFLPVVEFNQKELDKMLDPDIYTNVEKPVHFPQFQHFARQGLLSDRVRGVISSSSQRESPSAVFGFSTPGRIIQGSTVRPNEVWRREGGHSLVMDDGDVNGNDNLIRIRSSTGHQIMMNDTAGIIHIIAANGKNWIELGADGSIRAYATADISIRAENNINLTSDSTINLDASKINMKSGSDITMTAAGSINLKAGGSMTAYSSGTLGLRGSVLNASATSGSFTCSGELSLVGNLLKLNSGPVVTVPEPAPAPEAPIKPDAEPWDGRPSGTQEVSPEAKNNDGAAPGPEEVPRIVPSSGDAGSTVDNTKRTPAASLSFAEILATQPQPTGPIGILTAEEVRVLFANIAKSESNGNYRAVNTIGYSGKYQFGMAALEDAGYVKPGSWATYKRNIRLDKPEVWVGRDGINSQQDWLNSPAIQEKVMYNNTLRNYKTLVRIGGIRKGDTPAQVAGVLKVAHLLGAGGAKNWRNGKGGADAYGTTGEKYYDQGFAAINSLPSSGTVVT